MNKRQLELLNRMGKQEAEIVVTLKRTFMSAMDDILNEVKYLESIEPTESILNRLKFQKNLEKQVGETLHGMEQYWRMDVDTYLKECYEDGFIGAMYDIHGQGIPLVIPFNQNDMVNAIINDTKLSRPLYESLGFQVEELVQSVNKEIARGVATSSSYIDMARNIRNNTRAPLARTMTIARTEGHRVRIQSTFVPQQKARDNGADVVKQWDSTADKKTRKTHRELDGQIQEIDNDFVVPSTGAKAPHPAGFGIAKEDINCRCALLQRARWALDDDELKALKEKADFWGFNETQNFDKFKSNYLDAVNDIESLKGKIDTIKSTVSGGKPTEEQLKKAGKIFKDDYEKELNKTPTFKELEDLRSKNLEYRKRNNDFNDRIDRLVFKQKRLSHDDPDYDKIWAEIYKIQDERDVAWEDWKQVKNQIVDKKDSLFKENVSRLKTKLAEVRPMGATGYDVTGHLNNSRSPMRKVVESAYDLYPTSWVDKSLAGSKLTPKKVDRGFYSSWHRVIAISGDGTNGSMETAIHELGHRFEDVIPGIVEAEKKFYDRRTAGEALQWLGAGYDKMEQSRFDQFLSNYMGKDYGETAYELVSMGFEYAYTDPMKLMKDPDMAEWIFGILTMVD